jgi:hypothetical protein
VFALSERETQAAPGFLLSVFFPCLFRGSVFVPFLSGRYRRQPTFLDWV